ncbi:hypothetical protein Dsin_019421 [Dipteronia sinensis]|uniref:Uncharacterized protein n=1 Tax=Dipteronia sinensis TaxID=43782 RepID=A0AAE0E2Q6_9ROSI|nr:hypothetical protein Dsin_019421 [Dipteronia sinensis]
MDVQIVSKKLITPSHLQNMTISFMDQLISPRTVPFIFYYSANGSNIRADSVVERQKSLMGKSLSEILTLYYPLAGRYIKIMDAFTFSLFTNGWAKACKVGINDVTIIPNFESGILFPPRDISEYKVIQPLTKSKSDQVVTKRFVFNAKTISELKADHQATRLNCKPSTIEVLTALIWRAQINAARARFGCLRTSVLLEVMNLRGTEDDDDELEEFFFSKVIMKPYIEIFEEIKKGEGDVHVFSSLRNFPFYEVDFGWGKPDWVSFAPRPCKGVLFIDGKDGDAGVEAWVTMEEKEMTYFRKDPSIMIT